MVFCMFICHRFEESYWGLQQSKGKISPYSGATSSCLLYYANYYYTILTLPAGLFQCSIGLSDESPHLVEFSMNFLKSIYRGI